MSGPGVTDERSEIVRFVREVLGCGCPDDVVARTVIDIGVAGERGLDVGGRLLVRVLRPDDVNGLIDGFPETVERLREERDRRGFNRLRLVVHSVPDAVSDVLREMLPAIVGAEAEVYVHNVDVNGLPSGLIPTDRDRSS